MRTLSTLAYWEGLILLGGLFGVVLWKLFTGEISLDQLLEGDVLDANSADGLGTYVSTGRTQLLVSRRAVRAVGVGLGDECRAFLNFHCRRVGLGDTGHS